jgi:predicted ATP-binding protein involved in virulence
MEKLPNDFQYVKDMYDDDYFPNELVDKIKLAIENVVKFIAEDQHSNAEIQGALDKMTTAINDLQDDFENSGSELETNARESIGDTVAEILRHFKIDIDIEEAIRERDW